MRNYLTLFIILCLLHEIKAQDGPVKADELAVYPTYRKFTKIPLDSAYKITVENIHAIPGDIDRLKHLQRLTIFGNDWDNELNTIPSGLFKLENLTYLSIANTNIKDLGAGIKNCKNLETLIIANNKLVTLPKSLTEMDELGTLTIDNNIRDIPAIPSLEDLTIYFQTNQGNDSGTIPNGISKLPTCRILRIYSEDTKISISRMIDIIMDMPAIEKITFNDSYISAEDISRLSALRNIKELNFASIQTPPDIFKKFQNLKSVSFTKYLESNADKRRSFWENILALPKLEEVTTTFNIADTQFYAKLKKLNIVLDPSMNFNVQFAAIKSLPVLNRIEFTGTSNIPLSLKTLRTVKEIDFTSVYSQDFTTVFGCLQAIPSLEKIIVSNDQFLVFPSETAKLSHLKEIEVFNIQHGSFDVITEKEKKRARTMLPGCKFVYNE